MNTFAIKKMEIINSLFLVPGDSLDRIREYIETLIAESGMAKPARRSLKGIWKNKGFEKIADLDTERKKIRQEKQQYETTDEK
ncbi:MAG: hypothetical protein AB7S75_02920 [Desulfococcaceae bacterium]